MWEWKTEKVQWVRQVRHIHGISKSILGFSGTNIDKIKLCPKILQKDFLGEIFIAFIKLRPELSLKYIDIYVWYRSSCVLLS